LVILQWDSGQIREAQRRNEEMPPSLTTQERIEESTGARTATDGQAKNTFEPLAESNPSLTTHITGAVSASYCALKSLLLLLSGNGKANKERPLTSKMTSEARRHDLPSTQ
jgi:hypothetical protein